MIKNYNFELPEQLHFEWGVSESNNSLTIYQWTDQSVDNSDNPLGTDPNPIECNAVELDDKNDIDDNIVKIKVYHGNIWDDNLIGYSATEFVRGIQFITKNGNSYACYASGGTGVSHLIFGKLKKRHIILTNFTFPKII